MADIENGTTETLDDNFQESFDGDMTENSILTEDSTVEDPVNYFLIDYILPFMFYVFI